MKQKGYRAFIAAVLLAAVVVIGCPLTALAIDPLQVMLPSIQVRLKGSDPSPAETYQIVLKAGKSSYPMPTGSVAGEYTLTVKKNETRIVPAVSYFQPGVYTYTVYQIQGGNNQGIYDATVYTMKVYIANRQNGAGLESEIVLSVPGMDGKPDEIIFTNTYPDAPKPPIGHIEDGHTITFFELAITMREVFLYEEKDT